MSDFNSESRFEILTKNYRDIVQCFFGKTRIEFSFLLVSALWCNCFFPFLMFCINHGNVDVVTRRVGPRWWQLRTFWKAQNHPLHVRPSQSCQEVGNMLREAVSSDSVHGVAE